jgi:hypothetical protein
MSKYRMTFYTPKDFGYRTDNPGEDYCARKQRQAEAYAKEAYGEGLHGMLVAGPVTAYMGIGTPMYISAKVLAHLPGANQEERYRYPGDTKYDSLNQRVRDNGWDQPHPIMIRVSHKGRAVIVEGNTRSKVSVAHGVKDVLVQFEWVNGAENAEDDLWSPKRVAELCVPKVRDDNYDASRPVKHRYDHRAPVNEDRRMPKQMDKRKVLYRSVSIPELRDIAKTGSVRGGRNRFNDHDDRQYVFFGDKINERLIGQGEEIERQAHHSMGKHAIYRQMTNLAARVREEAELALQILKHNRVMGQDNYLQHFAEGHGNERYVERLVNEIKDEGEKHRALNAMRKVAEFKQETVELQARYRRLFDAEREMLNARMAESPYTSAILVTRPVSGGVHYSRSHGPTSSSGMGEDDEYGFQPGDIRLHAISKICMVKNGDIIEEITPDELVNDLDKFAG